MSLHPDVAVSASALRTNQQKLKICSSTPNTSLCVVCCEETEVTQLISEEIDKWDLPNVRSLLISPDSDQACESRHVLPSSESRAVAQSEYAIFITPSDQPCSQLKVNPLDKVCSTRRPAASTEDSPPATLLKAIHTRHGQSPQAWWIQLPTTEVRARCTQPVTREKSVAQALDQIGIFVRNYQVTAMPTALNSRKKKVATRDMAARDMAASKTAADKVAAAYRR